MVLCLHVGPSSCLLQGLLVGYGKGWWVELSWVGFCCYCFPQCTTGFKSLWLLCVADVGWFARAVSFYNTGWYKSRFIGRSLQNQEFILVLLFVNYCVFSITFVNLLLPHPVSIPPSALGFFFAPVCLRGGFSLHCWLSLSSRLLLLVTQCLSEGHSLF